MQLKGKVRPDLLVVDESIQVASSGELVTITVQSHSFALFSLRDTVDDSVSLTGI